MILYGASGHAKVIKDCIEAAGGQLAGIFDDDVHLGQFEGLDVHHGYNSEFMSAEELIISIGDNATRKKIAGRITHGFGKVIHPGTLVARDVRVGLGTVILHRVVVQAAAKIGHHVILNTAATVDHDCTIGDFSHIAPGVTICGNVSVGEGTLIGAGSTVIPGRRIGSWCVIGAGSVITADIPDYCMVMGIPGKPVKNIKSQ